MKRQLQALLEQLPPPGPARVGVLIALGLGSVVALAVPVFFALMLFAMLKG